MLQEFDLITRKPRNYNTVEHSLNITIYECKLVSTKNVISWSATYIVAPIALCATSYSAIHMMPEKASFLLRGAIIIAIPVINYGIYYGVTSVANTITNYIIGGSTLQSGIEILFSYFNGAISLKDTSNYDSIRTNNHNECKQGSYNPDEAKLSSYKMEDVIIYELARYDNKKYGFSVDLDQRIQEILPYFEVSANKSNNIVMRFVKTENLTVETLRVSIKKLIDLFPKEMNKMIYEQKKQDLETQIYHSDDSDNTKADHPSNSSAEKSKLLRQGISSFNVGEYSRGIDLLIEAEKELRKQHPDGKSLELADTLDIIARCYQEQGKYSISTEYYNKAIEIYQLIPEHDIARLANSLYNLGYCHYQLGHDLSCQEFSTKAIELLTNIGQNNTNIAANAHHNNGLAYARLASKENDINQQIKYYENSINDYNIALLIRNSNQVYNQSGNLDQIEYYVGKGIAQQFLADLYQENEAIKKQKLYEDSVESYCTALRELKNAYQEHPKSIEYYNNIFRVYFKLNDLVQSLKYCNKYLNEASLNNYEINQEYKVRENCNMIETLLNNNKHLQLNNKIICEYDDNPSTIDVSVIGEAQSLE